MTKLTWLLVVMVSFAVHVQSESHVLISRVEQPKIDMKEAPVAPTNFRIDDDFVKNTVDKVVRKIDDVLPVIEPLVPFVGIEPKVLVKTDEQQLDDVAEDNKGDGESDEQTEMKHHHKHRHHRRHHHHHHPEQNDQQLFGGPTDLDNPNAESSEESSSSEEKNSEEISNEDPFNQNMFVSWFNWKRPETFEEDGPIKKCMMHALMKYKASAYLRILIHLLFITGVMLIVSFMAFLTLRVIKRRRIAASSSACRHEMSETEADEKKKTPFIGLVFNSTKYARLNNEGTDKEDTKSLPDYEETTTK